MGPRASTVYAYCNCNENCQKQHWENGHQEDCKEVEEHMRKMQTAIRARKFDFLPVGRDEADASAKSSSFRALHTGQVLMLTLQRICSILSILLPNLITVPVTVDLEEPLLK